MVELYTFELAVVVYLAIGDQNPAELNLVVTDQFNTELVTVTLDVLNVLEYRLDLAVCDLFVYWFHVVSLSAKGMLFRTESILQFGTEYTLTAIV